MKITPATASPAGPCFDMTHPAPWRRYGLGLALFALAVVLRLGLFPPGIAQSFITFFPATAAAVLLCGLGPGLLVMGLGGGFAYYAFMPPFWSFKLVPGQMVALATYYAGALVICLVVNQMHKTRAALVSALAEIQAARTDSEEVLASIADGFYALDSGWRFTYVNPRAEEILGRKRDALIGQPFFEVFPMVRNTSVHANYQRVMTERRPLRFEALSPILHYWVSFSVYPGRRDGISVYFHDISAEKAVEAELVAARTEAERANLAKSKFLAVASHDLRQPVQSLVLFLEAVKGPSKGTPMEQPVQYMDQAIQTLNTMLNTLLDTSRLDAGALVPQIVPTDIGALARRIGAECEPRAAEKGLRLHRHTPSMLAMADPAFLERILRNLLENALRYTKAGGIVVGCRHRGPSIRIDIIDTGIGIPEEYQRRIFEEYVQVGSDPRERAKGLGLGLAIVSRLVSLMGGRIEVRSRPGRGSRFSVYVPAA